MKRRSVTARRYVASSPSAKKGCCRSGRLSGGSGWCALSGSCVDLAGAWAGGSDRRSRKKAMSEPNQLLQQIQVNTARGPLYQKDLPVTLPIDPEVRLIAYYLP